MKTNRRKTAVAVTTHEGGKARIQTSLQELRRTVMASMLWEDTFYENGESSADRVKRLIGELGYVPVSALVLEARHEMKLRHMPLYMLACMAGCFQHHKGLKELIQAIIKRADEPGELIAIYRKMGNKSLSNQLKKGIARSLERLGEYTLRKYAAGGEWRVRDGMFITHPDPRYPSPQAAESAPLMVPAITAKHRRGPSLRHADSRGLLFGALANDVYAGATTRESELSAGKDAKTTYTELLVTGELGDMALLKNLKTMLAAGVDERLIRRALDSASMHWVLPFRLLTAAKYAPQVSDALQEKLFSMLKTRMPLQGRTAILVDVSGSMQSQVSSRSEVSRIEAAKSLAILAREQCELATVFTFSTGTVTAMPTHLRGFALGQAIGHASGGTEMGSAVRQVGSRSPWDRMIVITDEQTADAVPPPVGCGYILNISTDERGVGFGEWTTISGMSESLIEYIRQREG